MVNSDMFDVSEVKVLKINNEDLREAFISPTREFHKEPYCLIKKLNAENEFVHPEDLMIEDDRTWGHYEFDFSANGKNKTPKYFYRNNVISQIETKNIEENDLTYKYKVKSFLDNIILSSLKENSNFIDLFNVAKNKINPNDIEANYSEGVIYIGIDNNYYEYYQGKLINLGDKYYAHVSVLSDVWDATNDITEKFYINKEITIDEIKNILKEQLNRESKEESLLKALSESIYGKIYNNNNGNVNINLIRQYIQQDIYHYYEINDELILDYSTNELYLKKNRLQHYLNIADGKSVINIELKTENYNNEDNCFQVEINNDFNFTKENNLQEKIQIEVINQTFTPTFSITSPTNELILAENSVNIIPNKTKVYIQTPSKWTELKEAQNYDFVNDANENSITKLKAIEGYNFSEKGLVKIFRKDKKDNILSENVSFSKENTNLIDGVEEAIKERLKNNLSDISYFTAFIEEKEEQENSSSVIIHNAFKVNFNINYNDDGSINRIIFNEKTEEEINNIKASNILSLTTSFIYPEEKLNYTLIKDENENIYLALDNNIVLNKTDLIYYKQDEFSSLALPEEDYIYEYSEENIKIIFNKELEANTQISLFYNPAEGFSSIQNVNLSLSDDGKKIIIKIYNLNKDINWKVGLIFSEYFNSDLSLSIFYQTRRIKDYLLSNRRVNWNVNNPASINYVLNRPIFQRNDKKIAMLEKDGKVYTNGEEDYYNFFVQLILAIAGEPNTELEDRIAKLEKWRKDEIDPYVIKLKTYQYKGDYNKINLEEDLVIGSSNVNLNNHSADSLDVDNESPEIWNQQYNKVGSMKALNDLADYCAALKKRLDSINGSLIHIGANSPDDEEKYACKVWLNTRKDNGNGIFYYRTVSKSEVPPIGAENYSSLLSASELWIPASAVWSNKVDTGSSGSGDNSNNDDENDLIRYQLLSELEVGNEVNIGGMTFTVVQKGLPTRDDAIVQDYGLAGLSNSNGRIYEKYFSEVQNGVFLIWTPSVESEGAIWVDENNQPLYKDITTERVSDHSVYNYTIRDNLKKLQTKLESEYNPSWFIKQVNYYRPTNATLYDGKIYLPTRNQLEDQRASVGDTAVYPAALDYFKTLSKERRKFSIGEYFTAELGKVDTEGIITGVSSIPEMSNTPMTANLRPLIVLNGNLAKVTQIDGSYYKLLKKSES